MNALCQLAGDWRGDLPPGGLSAEIKVNGWRALWLRDLAGKPGLWTRNGHPIEGVDHIAWRLTQLDREAGEPLLIDAEFQVGGTLAATKAWCERGWRTGGEAGVLHLFDVLTLAEWRDGGSERPLYERKARLRELFAAASGDAWEWRPGSHGRDDPDCVRVMPETWVFDAGDVIQEAHRVWSAGGEGLMLKDPCAPYRRKRSDAWQKVKRENVGKWRLAA